jgi:hypothetical protein
LSFTNDPLNEIIIMSEQATLPTAEQAEQACNFMAQEVHAPAFFEKLAAHDIYPRTQAEAAQLLEMGVELHQAELEGRYKTAAVAEQEQANPFLAHAMGQLQPQMPAHVQSDDMLKAAAAQIAEQDPVVKTAAELYGYLLGGGEIQPERTLETTPAV